MPDLDVDTLRTALAGTAFATLRYARTTGSTNDDAVALLDDRSGAQTGFLVVADEQLTGHGRRGRTWIAPAGSSLLLTAVLPGMIATESLWAVPLWCALAVADGVEQATSLRVDLQWPNDLLLDGRKCGGILCVSRSVGGRARVACGVGVNVRRPADPAQTAAIDPPPAFLSDRRSTTRREPVLLAIAGVMERLRDALDDPPAIARAWERRAEIAGTPYRILMDGASEAFEATARALDVDGSLLVTTASGEERRVHAGDARVLR